MAPGELILEPLPMLCATPLRTKLRTDSRWRPDRSLGPGRDADEGLMRKACMGAEREAEVGLALGQSILEDSCEGFPDEAALVAGTLARCAAARKPGFCMPRTDALLWCVRPQADGGEEGLLISGLGLAAASRERAFLFRRRPLSSRVVAAPTPAPMASVPKEPALAPAAASTGGAQGERGPTPSAAPCKRWLPPHERRRLAAATKLAAAATASDPEALVAALAVASAAGVELAALKTAQARLLQLRAAAEPQGLSCLLRSCSVPEPGHFGSCDTPSVLAREGGKVRFIALDDEIVSVDHVSRKEIFGDDPDYGSIAEERHNRLRSFARRTVALMALVRWRQALAAKR